MSSTNNLKNIKNNKNIAETPRFIAASSWGAQSVAQLAEEQSLKIPIEFNAFGNKVEA
jgi:hypothetical protein